MNIRQPRNSRRAFLHQSACALSLAAVSSSGRVAFGDAEDSDRFELSLHPYSVKQLFDTGELTLQNYAQFAKDTLNLVNVEFAAENCSDLFDVPDRADGIRKRSDDLGVTNRVLLCAAGNPLDAVTAAERESAVKHHLVWAKVTERLGCKYMRVRASTEGNKDQQIGHAAAGISALCDAVESSPVSILLENLFGHSRDPDWLVELVETIGTDRIGLIADFGNFDGDVYAGMKKILPFTRSLCTKSRKFDADGNETTIDFGRMMEIVKQSNYRGCIAIEHLGDEPVSGIRKSVALIQKAI